ncbi:HCP oxidoreductase, NADH-dependent [Salmonella enterica subsp. enterica serovar Paratyphi B str. SARA56]|nr:HCP oxidoreductase, NADH-dependent [Salmonella enterica subsp. enterica serovar Paratyphi B str. SARA56]
MTMPTSQCPWRMQVHHIRQETPDVWTIALLCHDYYPYRAGQYALVSVRNSAETLRAYTLSSTPGVSEYITLTVRRIEDGTGSQWLTHDIKRGDYIWLSDAMGDFTCDDKTEDKFLLLAAGCGVTPIMSMRRWLAKYRPQADVQVIFNVRSPDDVIFCRRVATVSGHASGGKSCHRRFYRGPSDHGIITARTGFGIAHHHDLRPGALYGFRRTGSESAWRNALL